MRALRVICAWCDECLSGPASAPATHTICRACVVKYFPAQALAIGALQDGSTFVAHDTATVPPRRARFVAGRARLLFSLLRKTWKAEARPSRAQLLSQVRPVCNDLREAPVVIPPGALQRAIRRVA